MATRLKLIFNNSTGNTTTYSYSYANPEMTAQAVNALVAGMITNGSIFSNPPVSIKSASVVTTTERTFDVSGS